tara:strand:- start:548 stop:895 length:348 start_codon:yes stop_codon:yes gene_type:complete
MLADSQLSSGVRFRKNDSAFGTKYKLSHKNNSFCWEEFNLDLTLTSLSIINATLYTRKRHCLMLFVRGHSSAGRAPALRKQEVVGSIPSGSTIFFANLQVTAEEFCEPSQTLGVS